MSRALKKHPERIPHHPQKQRLILLPGGKKHKKKTKGHFKPIWIFLSVASTVLISIVFFSTKHTIDLEQATSAFYSLHEIYRQEGLQRFLDEKNSLKKQVARTLENPADDEEEVFASTVAVYLFPDILPNTNFEKPVAAEQWAPLEEAIEKSPRTQESRLWFEEMRANIWNYENPDRAYPKISDFAKEALKIYDELSSP